MSQPGAPAPRAQPPATCEPHPSAARERHPSAARELTTPRLRLRHWRAQDEADMAAINEDPEVMRYVSRPTGAAASGPFLTKVLSHWHEHGFGMWAVESLEPELVGSCLGFVGIAYPKFLPELASQPEIGWRLARRAWGRGLATEGALAAREYAFEVLGLEALISIIHPRNTRSQRVAQKLGMTPVTQVHNPHMNRDVDVWQTRA
jgi:RimJ/RimL family protein N-acetyltransferase